MKGKFLLLLLSTPRNSRSVDEISEMKNVQPAAQFSFGRRLNGRRLAAALASFQSMETSPKNRRSSVKFQFNKIVEIGAVSDLKFCVSVAAIHLKGALAHLLVQSTSILGKYFGLDDICFGCLLRAILNKGRRFVTSTFLHKPQFLKKPI